MTHTSTEQQPEALMKLADDYAEACFDQGLHQRTADDKPEAAREKLEKELRRLHARVQELEASKAQRVMRPRDCQRPECMSRGCFGHCMNGITQEKQG